MAQRTRFFRLAWFGLGFVFAVDARLVIALPVYFAAIELESRGVGPLSLCFSKFDPLAKAARLATQTTNRRTSDISTELGRVPIRAKGRRHRRIAGQRLRQGLRFPP